MEVLMNIIEPGLRLDATTTKLIHCNACSATFADKKIPKICPNCGAERKKLGKAKDDECESFLEDYNEMLAEYEEEVSFDNTESGESTGDILSSTDNSSDIDKTDSGYYDSTLEDQSTNYDMALQEDVYEPIGYNPDDYLDSMLPKKKISTLERKALLETAEQAVREKKWLLQRVGLPTDGLQTVLQDIRQNADNLGKNIPGYTDLMLKMYVDRALQTQLRTPRRKRSYDFNEVTDMLQELGIKNSCWDSYYTIAGLHSTAELAG